MNIEIIKDIAIKAGNEILKVYNNENLFNVVDIKSDDSPLTLADKESNAVIESELKKHFPDIPILSEEGRDIPYEERKNWTKFWLVDPLDGTKEFIKRNGEFTVNIALISKNKPLLGVIYKPVSEELYYGSLDEGAFKEEKGENTKLKTNTRVNNLVAVGSRSHASEEENDVLSKYDVKEKVSIGSSLKFCLLAEGKADIYYRHGPTMEWDTAAGQAILESSGGTMLDANKKPFSYNKEVLRNSSFLCLSNKELNQL
ncbi:3'(2'),5'-bisphosphate nucleotidase CysQ [Cytophagaceae bacterium ABcell3]|nr:3'(2'),5'-bisphosphate nucleotidase CysQ [Cytophagaceae bacterium ABcell3]